MTRSDLMLAILAAIVFAVVISFWRAQRDSLVNFNLFDLIMENERVSKVAFSYMLVLMVTTWMMIYLTIQKSMTEGYFVGYGGLWVGPLVARIVFDKKEAPASTTVTTLTQQTTEVLEPKP